MKRFFQETHPLILIALAGFLVWGRAIGFGFVWDDVPMISNNLSLHQWQTLLSGWTHDFWMLHDSPQISGYWRPIPTMFHVLVTQVTGGEAWVFHLFNILLHIITTYFFYVFLRNTGFFKWIWIPVLFFLWHPIVVESVCFNSAVPDLLCSVFGWSAVVIWTGREKKEGPFQVLPFLFLTLSFLSKESGIFFGIFIIGIDILLKPAQEIKKRIPCYGFIAGMIAVYAFFHLMVIHGLGIRDRLWGGDIAHHLATVGKLFLVEFWLLFVPIGSSPVRDFSIVNFFSPLALGGVILLSIFVFLFFYFRKRCLPLAFVIFFYLIFWFPISNILPAEGLIADRYMYVTCMAVAFLIGLSVSKFEKFPKFFVLVLAGFAIWSFNNSRAWKNSETLWQHASVVSPKSSVVWNEWGNVQLEKRNFQEALVAYKRAVDLQPKYTDASFNVGMVKFLLNDSEALNEVKNHIQKFPDDAKAYDLLGSIYEKESKFDSAVEASIKSVEIAPDQWKYRYNLATLYLHLNRYDQAIVQLERISNPQRYFGVVKNLAAAYCFNAQYEKCLNMYQEFCALFPEKADEVSDQMQKASLLLQLIQEK